MSFADNLKKARTENKLSQEALAELLDVSRQAVSKWESGMGYPEVEKLLLISKKLRISLDSLMGEDTVKCRSDNSVRSIVITSPNENVIANCYKVMSTGRMRGGKNSPQYALFGTSFGKASFWGEPTTFLAWYANEEQLKKEISEIEKALRDEDAVYTLKYSTKTRRSWLHIKIAEAKADL